MTSNTIPTPASRRTVVETTGLLLSDRATGRPTPRPVEPTTIYTLLAVCSLQDVLAALGDAR